MKGISDSTYSATESGWGLKVVLVLLVFAALIAAGYWLRGQIDRERRLERQPSCPRCDTALMAPRPIPGRRR